MLNYSIELIPVSKVTESKLCIFLRFVICIFKLSSRKAVQDFSHQQWVTIIFQISKMYQMISKIISSSYLHQNLTDIPQTSLHVRFRIYHFPDHQCKVNSCLHYFYSTFLDKIHIIFSYSVLQCISHLPYLSTSSEVRAVYLCFQYYPSTVGYTQRSSIQHCSS